jgi:hypothetical protein
VVSVKGDKIGVKSTTFQRPSTTSTTSGKKKSTSKGTRTATPTMKTSNVTVTLPSAVAITETVAGTTADVAVGSCLTATGTTSAGSVTANRVVVSQPVSGSCTGGFGFGGGPRPGPWWERHERIRVAAPRAQARIRVQPALTADGDET